MDAAESRGLKKGNRVYWRGDATDSGIITEMSWDAVMIAWDNGKVATVHHGDMREIQRAPAMPTGPSKAYDCVSILCPVVAASDGIKRTHIRRRMHRQRMTQGAEAPLRSLTRHAISTMPQFVDTRGHRANSIWRI